jgi:spermidine/putrescine-binding protein
MMHENHPALAFALVVSVAAIATIASVAVVAMEIVRTNREPDTVVFINREGYNAPD